VVVEVTSVEPDGADILALARRVAGAAEPGEEIEAFVGRGTVTSVKVHGGAVESLTQASSAGLGVRVVRDKRQGFAWAASHDEAISAEVLAEARDNATFSEPDEWVGLASPDGVAPPDVELWRDGLAELSTDRKIELALELEAAVLRGDPRIVGVRTASWGDGVGEAAVVTSTGIESWGRATSCHLSVSALAEADDETKIGYGVSVGRAPDEVDLAEAAADAVDRSTRLLGAVQPASGLVTLVLEPQMTATLLSIVGGMLGGEAVLKGRSPFAERVGEAIASPLVHLLDDPTDPLSLGAEQHDGEGLATRRNVLLDGGVLQGFLHNTYTGRRSGTASTASAVRGYRSTPGAGAQALVLAPGTGTLDELVGQVDHGILVQSMTGVHSGVNPTSGDFSVGVEGLMIRGGHRAEPVREATMASTIQRLLLDVRAVGGEREWTPGGTAASPLVIDAVTLSGA
jgi:PmbA protein